ncbi:MAG: ATP-dependent zinc metalloprotease FtsH [Oscillibacter sp.]|nr:ATP-dependent zinc metalloprotease FtsH [Oscillibacter sp.]
MLVALLAALLLSWVWQLNNAQPEVEYSRVRQLFMQEKVVSFTVEDNTLTLNLREEYNGSKVVHYDLYDFQLFYNDLNPLVEDQYTRGIIQSYNYHQDHSTDWIQTLLPWILAALMIGVMWYVMAGRGQMMGGGVDRMARFGMARTRTLNENDKHITFADVAGADEEKEELSEIVDFLKDPEKYVELGARIPKGVLLVGPPGTGKTLLAKAVAGEAQVGFLSISGSDFVELYVGVGASRVRDLFEQAKRSSPAIVFIDEIDAVGRQRGAGLGGGHDEREQTLNQLLVEMDGFSSNEGVVVLAATNRADVLDPALLRPGRFDRQIYVGLPDIRGREEILQVHSKGKPLAEDVDLHKLAQGTSGFTGADLENLVNEGALLAARKNRPFITMDDLKDAEIKVIAGPEKRSRVIPQHERELTAWHEAGHAVVMYSLPGQDPVSQISIVPRGTAGGMTISLPEEDRSFLSRRYMEDKIVSLLGGRVAEQLCIGDISTGASNDLQRATDIARKMVASYGMSDRIGAVAFDTGHDEIFIGRTMAQGRAYSESVAAEIDQEIKAVLANAYSRCEEILKEHRKQLDSVAQYLLEHETMEREAFVDVMNGVEHPRAPAPKSAAAESKAAATPAASDNASKKDGHVTPVLSRILSRNGKRSGKTERVVKHIADSETGNTVNLDKDAPRNKSAARSTQQTQSNRRKAPPRENNPDSTGKAGKSAARTQSDKAERDAKGNVSRNSKPDTAGSNISRDTRPDTVESKTSRDTKPDTSGSNVSRDAKPDNAERNVSRDAKPDNVERSASRDAKPDNAGSNVSRDAKPDNAGSNTSRDTKPDNVESNISREAESSLPRDTQPDDAESPDTPKKKPAAQSATGKKKN